MRLLIAILLVLFCCMLSPHNRVQANQYHVAYDSDQKKPRIISKSQAISAAKRQVNGKVLSASLIRSKGPAVYRIKMLVAEKRVRTVFVDGKSGVVIRIN